MSRLGFYVNCENILILKANEKEQLGIYVKEESVVRLKKLFLEIWINPGQYNNIYNILKFISKMQEIEEVGRTKDKILSMLRLRGPSLPVQIARAINFSPLFASAFLSELKGEDKIKISNMRVGSSPLYYLSGQENMLEKFSGYLNQREKDALFLLRQRKILEDNDQTPVMRVALRAIKDFAVSVKVNIRGEQKLFWRYFAVPEEEVIEILKKGDENKIEEVKKKESVEEVTEKKPETMKETDTKKEIVSSPKLEVQKVLEEKRPLAERKKAKVRESEFVINVKDYLSTKDIEILEVYEEKKREFEARIRIDTLLGKQEFYLVAKDKKSVSDNDFATAHQKAQARKMLAVVMSTGDMNKRGKEHLEEWGNMIKWERMGF